jgi:hypothetical protein
MAAVWSETGGGRIEQIAHPERDGEIPDTRVAALEVPQ